PSATSRACIPSAWSTAPTSCRASRRGPGRRLTDRRRIDLMASESFDLKPVESIGVIAEGAPGQRHFFLQVEAGGKAVALACEKFHVQGLVQRIQELLAEQGAKGAAGKASAPGARSEAVWEIAELGLGYNESKSLFVIVAREAVA